MINNAAVLDTRKLMSGKDAFVYVEIDGKQYFYAEIDQFSVNMNVTNADVQPLGSITVMAVNTGVSFSLNFSEMVVRDDLIMKPLIEKIRQGKMPTYIFQGGATRWDGQEQRMTLRNCTPDGEFNLLNYTPGEIIKRNMAFRVNSVPEWLKALTYK